MNIKQYAIAGLMALSLTTGCNNKPVDQPERIIPLLQDVIAYRLDENGNKRHFIDEVPFGTLDEVVVLREKRVEIKPGHPEFSEQQKTYQGRIRPLYMGR